MCGIFGYFDRRGRPMTREALLDMGQSIAHRGPDDSGIFAGPHVGLGNQRLSIIDLEGGHQPFLSDDQQIALVQNGEIFNYVELIEELERDGFSCRSHSDTEVLLRLYEQDGIDFVPRLNGMFSIAIYDARIGKAFLIRDRLGVKPLYLYDDGHRILFGSEIKALLNAGAPKELDPLALHHYLTFNYVPPPITLFKGISHVPPGSIVTMSREGSTTRRWWSLDSIEAQTKRSEGDWIEELNTLLADAVRLRMRADVPFGAFLSGGVDSSTIVSLMARNHPHKVQTFTVGFGVAKYDESELARAMSEQIGTDHRMVRVDSEMLENWPLATYHCDQPHGDLSFLPTYEVCKLAVRNVKMVLTGDGGDELFAGYEKYESFFQTRDYAFKVGGPERFEREYFDSISLFNETTKNALYTEDFRRCLGGSTSFDFARPAFQASRHMDALNRTLHFDTAFLLPGNNLVKPDRMGMAVGLEARTPFMDYRIAELAFRMPGSLKLKDGQTKYILKKAVAPLIGEATAYRKKQMFAVPAAEWFQGSFGKLARETLLSSKFMERRIFDRAVIAKMIEAHERGQANNLRQMRALIALELWCRIFLDGDFGPAAYRKR